ncbi:hypothetical protein SAMN05443432_10931 [Roseovarius litoreus]|jgi:hypothetical protein|uniref:Dihydrodipicolinate reductase n=1 Tax=Roseovarius litoreus TaxID=1155722 RepID=A0A1M7JQ05_9RHOB|nr:dihydrodipicolinate reductase [Roseovarius litoreus]SHM55179.1 hypothetical protein SAMN05443432_10931 [Roseovarius litoreus]
MRLYALTFLSFTVAAPLPAAAEGFAQISDEKTFVSLVDGRKLTRFGIQLDVTDDGQIKGRAFGRNVTGAWDWRSGYFCRNIYWGDYEIGDNCQAVQVKDRTLRFISDQGTGDYADLRLQ